MTARVNNPLLIAYTQQLKADYWSWATDPGSAALLDSNAQELGAHLVQRLEDIGCKIESSYAIIHDQDMREVWDGASRDYVLELKPRHVHGLVKFVDRKGSASLEQIAMALGVEPQYVEKGKSGRYAFDNMLAYLIHAKYPAKHQYQAEEVATLCGRDYVEIFAEKQVAWRKGAAQVKKLVAKMEVEYLRDQILTGEISHEQVVLTDELFEVYSRHKRLLDDAFAAYGQRRAYRAAAKLRNGDFQTTILFIYGHAGTGKTAVANKFIAQAITMARHGGERWSVYRAATANPLDNWQGQEVILLDDLRGSAMEANDWLLLLDPVNVSPARARYANKEEVAPRLIILTATIPPEEYFYYTRAKGSVDEALDQFIRRLSAQVQVHHVDGERQYEVSTMGRLDDARSITLGTGEYRKTLDLSFGQLETVTHSAEGAVGALMGHLADASKDVNFSDSPDWASMCSLTETERDQHLALEAEKQKEQAALPAPPSAEELEAERARRQEREQARAAEAERQRLAEEQRQQEEEKARADREAARFMRSAELAREGQLDRISMLEVVSVSPSDEIVDGGTGRVVTVPRAGGFVAVLPNEEKKKSTVKSPWSL
ncbi:Rep family protein [Pseudoglutamicibacter cumminsii]|uniref:Plasmid replication-like protein n=1 Tax=Pseudoglutamicibacter cumminsii TaxID=156979 RepID=A0ABX5L3R5_9MICC|nr:Rep family protein [Pseudoglutamicibacter cumminsii]PWI27261.1 plasmid replication-like protein [Pseudoglutamicibacter cumminsii]